VSVRKWDGQEVVDVKNVDILFHLGEAARADLDGSQLALRESEKMVC
jgi:hypothetical protein